MEKSADAKGSYVSLEMQENREEEKTSEVDPQKDGDEELADYFDVVFWTKVRRKCSAENKSWSQAMDEVRVERLFQDYERHQDDPSFHPLLVILKKWPSTKQYRNKTKLLENQIDRLMNIILEKDEDEEYKYFKDEEDPGQRTLLHICAELNFVLVAKTVLRYYPGNLYITTRPHGEYRRHLPVELAIIKRNDDVAAFLVKQMKYSRVRSLFLCDDQEQPTNFSLAELTNMKKTVVAVLDCMITPNWPQLPKRKEKYSSRQEEEAVECTWNSVPGDPMDYTFYFQVLDGDDYGRVPKSVDPNTGEVQFNQSFDWSAKSCLYSIAHSQNKDAIQHPVVRLLVKRKWDEYAHVWFCVAAGLYVFFLLLLSFVLLHGATRDDPTEYKSTADQFRLLCEVFVIILIVAYVIDEINEAFKERSRYFESSNIFYNLFDWLGLVLVLAVIPLRVARMEEQWILASFGYFFNFLRLFKYSCVTRTTGLYTKTLARIIRRDITRFSLVFLVVLIAFCGTFFLSLRATGSAATFGGFEQVMLSGVRALVEQQPPAEEYSMYRWLPILVMLVYMTTVVVILLNILIAQMSSTYGEARKMARLLYDVDRMFIITRLENSRFHQLNLRLRYYKEEDNIDEITLAKELLEYSEERSTWQTIDQKLDEIREMMRKIIKRMPLSVEEKRK